MNQMNATSTAPTIPLPTPPAAPVTQGGTYVVMIVPSDEGERQAEAMENWFQACASDEPFSLELVGTSREQGFVLRTSSETQLVMLCKQFEAQYPQAEIHRLAPSADPLALGPGEHAVIGEFALASPAWMPLKTFSGKTLAEAGSDPLAGILAAMEPVGPGERIISQLALVRAPDNWIAGSLRKSVEHPLQAERDAAASSFKGVRTHSDVAEGVKIVVGLFGLLGAIAGYRWYREHAWLPLTLVALLALAAGLSVLWWWIRRKRDDIYDMKLVAEKLVRAAFYTQLRVIVIGREATSTEQQLRAHLKSMEVAYRQFTLASANSLYLKRIRHLDTRNRQAARLVSPEQAFPYAHPLLRLLHGAPGKDIWNGLELSGAFHLPQEMTDLPLVRRLSVKHLLFSPEIAYQIENTEAPLPPVLIGHSTQRSHQVRVSLPFLTLFSHKFLIGRSRSGKSVLIQLLAQGAMQRVRDGSPQPGLFCIDPHHDLIEDLLSLVPAHRTQDVLLLDLTEKAFPVSLNPLDATMGFTRDQAVSNLMASFERVWSDFWGPRMAYFLKNVCLLLYTLNEGLVREGKADQQFTLLDINPLLQYQDYAIQVLTKLDMSEVWHQELLAWWQNTYFTLPKNSSFRQEVILPILSKLGVFNDNQQLRHIVGQPITTAPVHEAVTTGKIVLCALASRDMDDAAVNILGSTLINLLHRAFASQHAIPLENRRKVFVVVDEFQAFAGGDYEKLLSEDGKYGCAMLLATQNLKRLNQIKEGLLEMVLSNCENLCAFNVSAADARILEEELQQKVSQKHIISQPRLHCYARLSIQGYPLQVASVTLAQPASWQRTTTQKQQAEDIRRSNQQRYLPAAEVDRLHAEHLKRFLDVIPYAQKIQREARATQVNKQLREAALQREAQLRADESQVRASIGTSASVSELPTSGQSEPATSAAQSPSLESSQTKKTAIPQQAAEPASAETGKPAGQKRNHRRSRRMKKLKKQPIGTPPPEPSALQDTTGEAVESARPLPTAIGMSRGPRERERERA